VIIELI